MKKGHKIVLYCALGGAVCLVALFFLAALFCKEEVPVKFAEQVVALRVYDLNPWDESAPSESNLVQIPHVDIGKGCFGRLFQHLDYRNRSPFIAKRLYYFVVATCSDGQEYRLHLLYGPSCVTIEGKGGCNYFQGAAAREMSSILNAAMDRVFFPAYDMRASVLQPGDLVPIKQDTKYGYADPSGKVIIQAKFDDVHPSSDGLAAVRVGDAETGKWGYIDATGRFAIEPQFAGASFFSNGLAVVTVDDFLTGKQGYINREGRWVIEPQFERASVLRKNGKDTPTAQVTKNGKSFVIDTTGGTVP